MRVIAPTLMLAVLLALSLTGISDSASGFSGVTGITLTSTRSTGVNEAIAVNAPQSVDFSIKVNGKADASLRGNVTLTRLNGPRHEWRSYFTTDAAGRKTMTSSFPGGGTIPNAVGRYNFQASLRQQYGTTVTSNIITIVVYTVRCVKIEASHNEKIYWPTAPHYDDKLWEADSKVFAETGNLKVVFDRKHVADIMRPSPQYYRLNFTLQRYPPCNTSQQLVTEVSVVSTGGRPATTTVDGWTSPYIWVTTSSKIGRRAFDLHFTFKVNARPVNPTPQRVTGFVDYAIYGKPLCAKESFTNERLHYATGWGAGSSKIIRDGPDSISWVVQQNIKTAGYTFTFLANPWMLLSRAGDCDTHANLMKDVLAILGVPATTTRMVPSGPLTRNNCGIPEHYRYRSVERRRFRYDNGGNPVYVNWHAVCTVNTTDRGIIHYDIIGHRAYGTSAQMQDEDEDRTKADFKNDVINGDIGWVYDLKDNQRAVCPVP